jgi:hypothetical protein
MERRSFLKIGTVSACALSLPMQALLSSFVDQRFVPLKQLDEFSMFKLNEVLGNYQYPSLNNFNSSSYLSNFKTISLIQGKEEGKLVFGKEKNLDRVSYHFQMQRYIPGDFAYTVQGKVQSGGTVFPWVDSWESISMVSRTGSETPYLKSNRLIKGRTVGKKVLIEESGRKKHYRLSSDSHLAWKWGMIDLIPAMAYGNIQSLGFAVLDETDVIYQEQIAKFKMNASLSYQGSGDKIRFKVYDVTGTGVIPTVYWIDEFGRTVFVITGAEAYVLL